MNDLSMNTTQLLDLSRGIVADHILKEAANKTNSSKETSGFDAQMKQLMTEETEASEKENKTAYESKKETKSRDAIKEAAEDLEAVFLSQMLSPVFENMGTDPLFGGGHAEQVYRSMIVQEYGKSMAESGGIGLQKYIANQIAQYQKGAE